MMPTLFEAIRQLKPGQRIVPEVGIAGRPFDTLVEWKQGEEHPIFTYTHYDWQARVAIIDLPKPQPTLYDVLVDGATSKRIRCSDINYSCAACKYHGDDCTETDCSTALIDTLCDIALAAGFDLKKITAGEGEDK